MDNFVLIFTFKQQYICVWEQLNKMNIIIFQNDILQRFSSLREHLGDNLLTG